MNRRLIRILTAVAACAIFATGVVQAATLQQLSLGEMGEKATAVVRVRVTAANGILRGADVYTVYKLQVLETWKPNGMGSTGAAPAEVAVPGGVAGGLRQMVPGAPTLHNGEEYVLFLWTGRSGLTQLVGLSQGVLAVSLDSQNESIVQRAPSGERMLNAHGREVQDQAVAMKLAELKKEVLKASNRQGQAPVLAQRSAK